MSSSRIYCKEGFLKDDVLLHSELCSGEQLRILFITSQPQFLTNTDCFVLKESDTKVIAFDAVSIHAVCPANPSTHLDIGVNGYYKLTRSTT